MYSIKRLCRAPFVLFLALFFTSPFAFAAAFQLYELGTPIVGSAGVGQAAVANDASTSYFNPAGMVELKSSQYLLGSQIIAPSTQFSIGGQNTILGNNGGNAALLTPGASLYYVNNYSSKVKFGVSFTTPYGGFLNYNDGWVGRYNVQNVQLYALNLNPSLAYKINEQIALGAGIAIEYVNLQQTVALPIPETPLVDGQVNIKTSNIAPGFNLGVMLTPSQTTKIGIAYRSRILHNLSGNTTFLRISSTPTTSTKMTMPQNIIVSLSQALTSHFNLLAELGWANWASMKNTIVVIDGYSATTALDWSNTYRAGIAGQFIPTPNVLLQAGASFDSSPTTTSRRLPNLPMDRQVRLGAGIIYSVAKAVNLGFSYEYINFGSAGINNTSSSGVLAGSYSRNFANVLQASVNVVC